MDQYYTGYSSNTGQPPRDPFSTYDSRALNGRNSCFLQQYTTGMITPTTLTSGLASTPLLTPSTLSTIEQIFTQHTKTEEIPVAADLTTKSGFVPPLVGPTTSSAAALPVMVKQEYEEMECSSEDPDWLPPGAKRSRVEPSFSLPTVTPNATVTSSGSRRPTGPRAPKPSMRMTPEEEEKRQVRRERNKLAAAKCRQRRVDLTNRLLNESEGLEEEQASLEEEIQKLQAEKEQLEFLLEAHKPLCSRKGAGAANYAVTITSSSHQPSIKVEQPASPPLPRPTSLAIKPRSLPTTITESTGIPISTPSNGISVYAFGLEAMVDGHTGLTPLTNGPPSCSSEVQRSDNRSITSSAQTLASPTTLMAL